MSKFRSFEEINSWQKSRVFNKLIYQITENANFKKDFDFIRQIRRSSISISSNIAEGFERNTDKEFVYFLYVAKASAGEVRSQLYLAYDLEYITKIEFEMLLEAVSEISKMLSGFIKYLSPKE
ncbi:MAG: four helix bundle protein [Flavobacterium sp. BFFFF2]|nr:MAG: four helix bundle protein [Flavobacterium sp. BFFFF2]